MVKKSAAMGSALPDPATDASALAPVPTPAVENKTAPGQTGPKGMSPRTTYARVNTGAPPTPDMSSLKAGPPRGAEFLPKVAEDQMSTAQRPSLQDMVKAAMAGTINKVDINAEASRQAALHAGEDFEEKTASAEISHYSTEHVTKLAAALGFIADQIKEADQSGTVQAVGKGPGALHVSGAKAQGRVLEAGQSGHAVSKDLPAASVQQKEKVQVGKANTGLATNDDTRHPNQPLEPIPNQKVSIKKASDLQASNLDRVYKLAGVKVAEDAINPAKIQAGAAEAPTGTKSGEGVPAEPSDVNSQKRLISSNEAAINYTKQEAKADPKSDVNHLLDEPALSAAHDNVLNKAFAHTGQAGVKISSAVEKVAEGSVKIAAARALLSKLVKTASAECKDCGKAPCVCKKEKKSAMGAAPSSPSSASGFTASSLQ